MADEDTTGVGSSSSGRDRHRHSELRSKHDDCRSHSSRSDSRKEDRHHRSSGDRERHRHHHHRSHHHSSDLHDRHRERETEEDRLERKRRRREEERDGHKDESRKHESRSHHRRHRDESSSSHRSRNGREHSNCDAGKSNDKQPATDFIPTSESLDLTSNATHNDPSSPPHVASTLKRDDWMTGNQSATADPNTDEISYFSSLGKAKVKAPPPEKPDPEKLKISSRELNTQLVQGKTVDEYDSPAATDTRPQLGAPGHQWRMMKLKRTLEAAEQEGRRIEEVALERYASLEDFEHAKAERRFLDGKSEGTGGGGRGEQSVRSTPTLQSVARRSYLLASGGAREADGEGESRSGTDSPSVSRSASRQAFRRPGEASNAATPTPAQSSRPPRNIGFETPASKPSTPTAIPTVFTPVVERPPQAGTVLDDGSSDPDRPILAPDQLNKLQAKILQAELMGDSQLESLRTEYDRESARAQAHRLAGDRGGAFAASSTGSGNPSSANAGVLVQDGERELQVLPTLDARGRMYDIGSLAGEDPNDPANRPKRKLKGRDEFEARDPKTGEIVRYSADDDSISLGDLVRQEKFGAGSRWQKDPDAELAANIMSDAGFSADLDQQDEEAHRYAKKKMRSDALKRQFAINDLAQTRKALDRCRYCWQDEGAKPPRVTVVSSGYRAYLAVPDVEAITPDAEDHVLIVPMQHHLSLLEADDGTWDEIKNFQKCLVQLAASQNKSVVFFESVLSLKPQLHSIIEAVLLPATAMSLLPGVFKQSLCGVGGEFSTHAKVIDFTPARPFRNALVPNLPYFAVTFDYRWSTGYGHVIENMDGEDRAKEDEDAYDVGEMAAGSAGGTQGKFDPNFARDIIRGVLEDLDNEDEDGGGYMRSFGRSKRRSEEEKRRTKDKFAKTWDEFDWTKMLRS